MKSVRWTQHAIENLANRAIDPDMADAVVRRAKLEVPDSPGRRILMGRYHDGALNQEMLLRIVVEELPEELVVVTVYKTSQIRRYLKGLLP